MVVVVRGLTAVCILMKFDFYFALLMMEDFSKDTSKQR